MHRGQIIQEARDLAHVYRITTGDTFRLQDIDPADTAGLEAEDKPRAISSSMDAWSCSTSPSI